MLYQAELRALRRDACTGSSANPSVTPCPILAGRDDAQMTDIAFRIVESQIGRFDRIAGG